MEFLGAIVGVGDPSTFLGYGPCLRMIKYPRTVKRSMCTWVGRLRRKEESDVEPRFSRNKGTSRML